MSQSTTLILRAYMVVTSGLLGMILGCLMYLSTALTYLIITGIDFNINLGSLEESSYDATNTDSDVVSIASGVRGGKVRSMAHQSGGRESHADRAMQ